MIIKKINEEKQEENKEKNKLEKKLKIIFLIDSPRKIGGGDYAQFYFATQLAKKGHEITIIAKDKNFYTKELEKKTKPKNLKINYYHSIPLFKKKIGIGRINKLWAKTYYKIIGEKKIRKTKPDWIIGYLRESAIRATKIGLKQGIRTANFVFETPPWMEEDIPKEWEEELKNKEFKKSWEETKKAYKNTQLLIPNSELSKKMLIKWLPEKKKNTSQPIYPGVKEEQIKKYLKEKENKKEWSNREYDIAYVGRLNKLKNVNEILEAAIKLKKQGIKLKIIIIGSGEEEKKLIRTANENKLEARFTGNISDEEKWDLLRKTKLLVFPSSHEGFGMPPLEALISGCQVLCSNKKIFKEVYGRAVHYFELHDTEEMAEKIKQIIKEEKTISKKIIKEKIKKYSWEESTKKLEEELIKRIKLLKTTAEETKDKETKKKIAIYHPNMHLRGGGEKVALTIASALKKNNEVTILTDKKNNLEELGKFFNLDLEGIKMRIIGKTITRIMRIMPKRIRQYKKNILLKTTINKLNKYDIVIDTSTNGLFYKKIKPKTIAYIHFPNYKKEKKGIKKIMNPLIIKTKKMFNYDIIITNSEFTKKEVEEIIMKNQSEKALKEKKIIIINPPVDITETKKIKNNKKQKIITTIGRYSPEKKLEVLIKTFKELEKKIPDYELIIIGSYNENNKEYYEKLRKLAGNSRIRFLKNIPNKEVLRILSKTKIYWHSRGYGETDKTEYENFGITTVEAMSAGCIPITINLGAQPEIIKQNHGFLWNNTEELKEKTLKAIKIKNYDKKLKKDYSKERFIKEITRIIKTMK